MENLKEEKAASKTPIIDKTQNQNNKNKQPKPKKKKYGEFRDPFYRRFFGRLNTKKEREQIRKNLGQLMELPSYRFRCCPWNLWSTGIIILLFNGLMTYCLYYIYEKSLYNNFLIFINILFYYLSFTLFYTGEIEYFTIDRSRGFVKKSEVNIFGSQKDRVVHFDEIDYCQMVMKGTKKGANDNRKFYLRIYVKDKMTKPIEFGSTWHFDSISFKYQVCLAMIKGIVVEKVEKYLIKDEALYPDYMY